MNLSFSSSSIQCVSNSSFAITVTNDIGFMNGLPTPMGMSAFYAGAPAGNFMLGAGVMNGIGGGGGGSVALPPSNSPKVVAATTTQQHQHHQLGSSTGVSELAPITGGRSSRPSSTASSTEPPSTKMPRLAAEGTPVEGQNGSAPATGDLGGGAAAPETPKSSSMFDDDAASYQSGSEDPPAAIIQ